MVKLLGIREKALHNDRSGAGLFGSKRSFSSGQRSLIEVNLPQIGGFDFPNLALKTVEFFGYGQGKGDGIPDFGLHLAGRDLTGGSIVLTSQNQNRRKECAEQQLGSSR